MKKLEFELDKDTYYPGDNGTATVTFVNTPDGWFGKVLEEVRSFNFDIYGYENTNITVKERRPIQSPTTNQPPPRDLPNTPPRDLPNTPPRDLPNTPPRDLPNTPPRDLPDRPPRDLPDRPPGDLPNQSFEVVSVDYSESNPFLHIDLDDKIQKLGEKISNDKIRVKEGTHKIEIPFTIPDKSYETYNGTYANIFYRIETKADIPLRPDLNAQKNLKINHKSQSISSSKPLVLREGNNSLYAELKIHRDTFTPGDTINGRIEIKNTDDIPVRNILLNLVGLEYASVNNNAISRTYN